MISPHPNGLSQLSRPECLGDEPIAIGCSVQESIEIAGIEVQRHLDPLIRQLHSGSALRMLCREAETWVLQACPALLRRFSPLLHPQARVLPLHNMLRIRDRDYIWTQHIAPSDPQTLELSLLPLHGSKRLVSSTRHLKVHNITRARVLFPPSLAAFDSENAAALVAHVLETGYRTIQAALMAFVGSLPWSAEVERLYRELARTAQRQGIAVEVAENLIFGAKAPGGRVVHLLGPPQVAQIMRNVAMRSEPDAYSALTMAVELIACNLPVETTHSRFLGPRLFDPLPRRFSESDYDKCMVAGEIAHHGSDDFALVGGVASEGQAQLWAAIRLDQSRQAAELFRQSEAQLLTSSTRVRAYLTEGALTCDTRLPGAGGVAVSNGESPQSDETVLWRQETFNVNLTQDAAKPLSSETVAIQLEGEQRRRGPKFTYDQAEDHKYYTLWVQTRQQKKISKEQFAVIYKQDPKVMRQLIDRASKKWSPDREKSCRRRKA